MKNSLKNISFFVVMVAVIILGALLITSLMPGEEMMNSELIDQIAADNVDSIVLNDKDLMDVAVVVLKSEAEVTRYDEKGNEKTVKLKPKTKYEVLVSEDFDSYVTVREQAYNDYENRLEWAEKMLVNIAKAGFFAADRSIEEYAKNIWKLTTVTPKSN